jgi:hypothetical protein
MKRTDIDAIEQLLVRLPVELKMCGYIVGCFHGQAQLSPRTMDRHWQGSGTGRDPHERRTLLESDAG